MQASLGNICVVLVEMKSVAYIFLKKIIKCIAGNWMGERRRVLAPRGCLIVQQIVNIIKLLIVWVILGSFVVLSWFVSVQPLS